MSYQKKSEMYYYRLFLYTTYIGIKRHNKSKGAKKWLTTWRNSAEDIVWTIYVG